ncbi:LLM class flavin-dependent oxidoreductase [Rhodococcus sp. P1Y]|uniref:LLM class flavin-dependent oxidoreductase n=1 Tax=Rhodococcus sp. P1Y TaxID=1302308 RepID=UPI000EABEB4E|nr:LLM class flavin-dependent oxidoreductase [Rhodococcus sp. P1Y]AYJ48293.1 LLM class flavin-dependent oxidoreductase [Rhodococcus sp. P1Y]
MTRTMHLALFAQGVGVSQSVWRSPRTDPAMVDTLKHWAHLAQTAERGCFDAFFVADQLNLAPTIAKDATDRLDPVVILSALAAVTSRIGLVGTSSTTYNDPYTVARQFASLDHLSNGRAGWNVVTTAIATAAANYGSAGLPDHTARYERGEEFVDVVRALWEAWEADAIVGDVKTGEWADLSKIHSIEHEGTHFQVKGPLTVPRSPQGRIPLAQAGSSPVGVRLGARVADMVFTTQHDLDAARGFAEAMRTEAASFGRDSNAVRVLPGITPIVGRTEQDASELARELGSLISEESTLGFLQQSFGGLDLTKYDLDEKFPDIRAELPDHAGVSRPALFIGMALDEGLTVRELAQRVGISIGHRPLVGTPDSIADEMELWFTAGAADGFIVLPADLPVGLEEFVELVVPRLQDRGLLRTSYTGSTLREHLDE